MSIRPVSSSRRDFLRMAAASSLAIPYVITSRALGMAGSLPASERITTALIGSGSRGQQIVAGASQVLAVCDVDAKHLETAQEKINAMTGGSSCDSYGDYRDVLARDDIDAVVIAAPDHWHALLAIEAMRAGKAVYVEKPLSLTIREGRLVADAARRWNGILQVGSQQRTDEKFIRACELVRNGRIGELQRVQVEIPTRAGDNDGPWTPEPVPPELDYDMWLGPAPWAPYHPDRCHYKFRFVTDYSGGDVTNWGAHQLDIAQFGIGADDGGPVAVQGHGKQNAAGLHDVFYDVHVDFTYANGVEVHLRSGGNGVRFEGTEGWVYVDRSRLEAEPKSLSTSKIGPDEIQLARAPEGSEGTHMGIWLHAIRERSTKVLNVNAEIGHRSATLCHLANIAMALRRPLKWDPEQEHFVDDEQANRMTWRPARQPWRI